MSVWWRLLKYLVTFLVLSQREIFFSRQEVCVLRHIISKVLIQKEPIEIPLNWIIIFFAGLHQLLNFLKTDNHELLRTTTGVLVNLMADADKREALHHSEGLPRYVFTKSGPILT